MLSGSSCGRIQHAVWHAVSESHIKSFSMSRFFTMPSGHATVVAFGYFDDSLQTNICLSHASPINPGSHSHFATPAFSTHVPCPEHTPASPLGHFFKQRPPTHPLLQAHLHDDDVSKDDELEFVPQYSSQIFVSQCTPLHPEKHLHRFGSCDLSHKPAFMLTLQSSFDKQTSSMRCSHATPVNPVSHSHVPCSPP